MVEEMKKQDKRAGASRIVWLHVSQMSDVTHACSLVRWCLLVARISPKLDICNGNEYIIPIMIRLIQAHVSLCNV